jgi:hypothetical protein
LFAVSWHPLVSLRLEGTAKDEGTGEFMPGGYRAS